LQKTKILVTGFPHTGTSILKSKFGECSNLHEVVIEQPFVYPQDIHNSVDNQFILVKNPILPIDIRAGGVPFTRHIDSRYYDYSIIFVIRNPWNVFTSIIKDGGNPLNNLEPNQGPQYHIKVQEYMVAAEFFLQSIENNYPNIHAIKYEDFFPNNYLKFRELLDTIGLEYTDDIFINRTKNYIHMPGINYDSIDANNISYGKNRLELRTWQINQPFQNMNGEVDIPDELSDILENSPIIKQLGYTDPRKIK
jgi:hypothetical protein